MTENNSESEEEQEDEERSIWLKRASALILILGGSASAGVSHMTVGFGDLVGVLPVLPVSLVTILIFRYIFDSFSRRAIPFTLIVTFFIWFITGTVLLQTM